MKYLQNLFCEYENDIFQKLLTIYDHIENINIEDIIKKMNAINFFCSNNSILWKYRFKKFENLSEDECNKQLKKIKIEKEKFNNLIDLWNKEEIEKYNNISNEIIIELLSIKSKNEENKKIFEIKKKAKDLINKLDNNFLKRENLKDDYLIFNKNYEKQVSFIKQEIQKFLEMERPTLDIFNDLEFKVKIFIQASHQTLKMEGEKIFWPISNIIKKINLSKKNFYIDEYIIWYSQIKPIIDNIINNNLNKNEFFESILKLYKDSELEPIINYINDYKKINNNRLNYYFSKDDINIINNLLRGIFINKILKEGINKDIIDYLINYIEILNKEINPIKVSQEDYFFINSIANKYSYNLQIIYPFFEHKDIFYLFFKYQNNNNFIKNEIIKDLNISDKKIGILASEIYKNINELSMFQIAEKIIIILYENTFGKSIKDIKDLKIQSKMIKEEKEKNYVYEMIDCMILFEELDKIIKNKKNNIAFFNCSDISYLKDFIEEGKNNKNIISTIFEKGKNKINSLILYYINEHKEIFEVLFNILVKSNISFFKSLTKNNNMNYLPFWIYILRKISSINCIEIKENEKPLKKYLKEQIKDKLTTYISENKKFGTDWINLISIDISNELLEKTTRNIAIFFDILCKNINKDFLKNFKDDIINIFKKLFSSLIQLVFDNKLINLIECPLLSSNHIIINFIVNPSKYIYSIIKDSISIKFKSEIDKIKDYKNNIDSFINLLFII